MTATLETKAKTCGCQQIATLYVGDTLLGIPIDRVQEINRHVESTRVPHAPESIRGVINLRGDVVTIVDLATVLELDPIEVTDGTRNIVIQSNGQLIGLLVDRMADILTICDDDITETPANTNGIQERFFHGVYSNESEIVVILDIDEVLAEPK